MSRVVATLRKNAREHLRVSWDAYSGHDYLDLRIVYEDGEELKPSKKGVTVRPAMLADLIPVLMEAQAVGREMGLLPSEPAE